MPLPTPDFSFSFANLLRHCLIHEQDGRTAQLLDGVSLLRRGNAGRPGDPLQINFGVADDDGRARTLAWKSLDGVDRNRARILHPVGSRRVERAEQQIARVFDADANENCRLRQMLCYPRGSTVQYPE